MDDAAMNDQELRDAIIAHMAASEQQMKQVDKYFIDIKSTLKKGDERMGDIEKETKRLDGRMNGFDKQIAYVRGGGAVIALIYGMALAWAEGLLKGVGK